MLALLTAALTDELDALLALAPLRVLLWFVVLAGLVWLMTVVFPLGVRIAWQLGVDRRRRLTIATSLARLLAPFVALIGGVAPFWEQAPTLSLIGLATFVTLAALASPSSARNLAAGVGLALRAQPRPGDVIKIGELTGTVDDVGLMRVSLRTSEGGLTLVPAADFERMPVTIGSHTAAVSVEVDVQSPVPLDDAVLERLRRALWFSPFRRAGSAIRLVGDRASGRLHATIDSWAPQTSVELQRHVSDLLLRNMAPPVGPPPVADPAAPERAPSGDGAGEEDGHA